jgi:DNA repair exonuclease SbcCD ATPase subunit
LNWDKLDVMYNKSTRLSKDLLHAQQTLKHLNQSIDQLTAKVQEVKKKLALHESLDRFLNGLVKPTRDLIRHQLPTHIVANFIELLEVTINRFMNILGCDFRIRCWTEHAPTNLLRRDAITQSWWAIFSDGRSYPIKRLSAGQTSLFCLAFCLAWQKLLEPKWTFLALDEPTAHLDMTNRARIIELLKKLAGEHSYQIVCITHDSDLVSELAGNANIIELN